MVLPPEKIRESIFSIIPATEVAGIYQVGMVDTSPLSDTDVVIVLKTADDRKQREMFGKLSVQGIDVHGVLSEDNFFREVEFFDTAELRVIFGELPKNWMMLRQDSRRSLVKLSSLFFTSFLRNFYELVSLDSSSHLILKHLNDFEYVEAYTPDLITKSMADLLKNIRSARQVPENISRHEIQKLVRQGIDEAWNIIAILNERLKNQFEQEYPPTLFLGRQPTVFAPFSVQDCRQETECFTYAARARILVLPLGFQFIFTNDDFIAGYVKRHLMPPAGLLARGKHALKILLAYTLQKLVYKHRIYQLFSPSDAYGVKRAVTTYHDTGRFTAAEKMCFDEISLPKESEILDVGCGAGRTTFALIESGFTRTFGVDFAPTLIAEAQQTHAGKYADHFQLLNILDAEKVFKPNSFDAILFSFNGLDYLFPYAHRLATLRVIAHLLKPSGIFIFSTHRPFVLNRDFFRSLVSSFWALIHRTPYAVVQQSFGKLLTYRGSERRICRELADAGLEPVKKIYNLPSFPQWRDPFPYWIVRKRS